MRPLQRLMVIAIASLAVTQASAQTGPNLTAMRGLAPVTTLPLTEAGRAALQANFTITGAIQTGTLKQPILLPFAEQQQQAVQDAFITGGNAAGLADGLGTRLGTAYRSMAHYDGPGAFTSVSSTVANLIAYTNETTASDSNAAKFFFANLTTNGSNAVSPAASALLAPGSADVFGRAYGRPAGTQGADPYGNSRPFQTEPSLTPVAGPDYFGTPSDSAAYLRGPEQDLTDSPSFPSGHTTYGTMESMLLALMVPERYEQQVARAAEYGNDRIILGAHYTMDVIAGRTLALHDLAHLLANDPAYVGQPKRRAPVITDYPAALAAARADMAAALQSTCGAPVATCAASDDGRFHDPAANAALVAATQTYGLPVVYPAMAAAPEDVATIAPEAGHLLTAAFPQLTLAQADAILTATEGPGGGFLDDGSSFGLYSRLDLYAAAAKARATPPN